jgi:NitT/TauT family transport system ATP-binding protein
VGPAPKLHIENVALRFTPRGGPSVTALENISLDVGDKEFSVIVGPSGCGKTSLLRLVAGLIEPSEGAIYLDSQRVRGPGKDRGMVFQSYTLFPWLTVQDNVEFGLRIGRVPALQRREIARRFIAQVGLEGFEGLYPKQLSGGMMQRVALARALANDPPSC